MYVWQSVLICGVFSTAPITASTTESYQIDLEPKSSKLRRQLIDLNQDGIEDYYSVIDARPSTPISSSYLSYVNTMTKAYDCGEGYFGYGCSKRKCSYEMSWTVSPFVDSDPSDAIYIPWGKSDESFGMHVYEECGGKGICNYDLGKCSCFDGFFGKGCRYKSCPNDCGQHGVCQGAYVVNPNYNDAIPEIAQSWDRERMFRCSCDYGYSGIDCSNRICPTGLDPVNPHDCYANIDESADFAGADQQLIQFPSAMPDNEWFYLEFDSKFGGNAFRTHPISYNSGLLDKLAGEVQSALEALPNKVVTTCQTRVLDNDAGYAATILVAFTDSTTAGRQNLLNCIAPSSTDATQCQSGVTPKILSGNTAGIECETSYYNDESEVYRTHECSSRGECDQSSGKCICHSGFEGNRCETMFSFY